MPYFSYSQSVPIGISLGYIGYSALGSSYRPSTVNQGQVFTVFIDNSQNGSPLLIYLEQEAGAFGDVQTIVLPIAAGQCLILGGYDWSQVQYLQGMSLGVSVTVTIGVWSGTGAGSGGYYNPAFSNIRTHNITIAEFSGVISTGSVTSGNNILSITITNLITADRLGIFTVLNWGLWMYIGTCSGTSVTITCYRDGTSFYTFTASPSSQALTMEAFTSTAPNSTITVTVTGATLTISGAGNYIFGAVQLGITPDTSYVGSLAIITWMNGGNQVCTDSNHQLNYYDNNILTGAITGTGNPFTGNTTDSLGLSGDTTVSPIQASGMTNAYVLGSAPSGWFPVITGLKWQEIRVG